MRTVHIDLPGRAYDILIGERLLAQVGVQAREFCAEETVVVVTDETVWALYGEAFATAMKQTALPFTSIVMPPGEGSKSLDGLKRVYEGFARGGLTRRGLVIAFGGGVVGDLAGFAAASWMRGVDYLQVPTTLLSQVDSSVGGKTAINLPAGKNLVGAFHQPKRVLIDTGLLRTLPPEQFAGGMAEVIKYGAIRSRAFLDSLMAPPADAQLPDIIERCCRIKAEIVSEDEREGGVRTLLNLGHTFGHAVEALGGYSRHNHGQGVAIGMVLAATFGERVGVTPSGTAEYLSSLLEIHGLPTRCPYSIEEMIPVMKLDKKGRGDSVDLVLLKELGQAVASRQTFDTIAQYLREGYDGS